MLACVPTHTPYDGSAPPFTVGLSSIDPSQWIEVDDHLDEYLAEKERLWESVAERVFVAEPGSEPAQGEVLDLLVEHLPKRYPDIYELTGDRMQVGKRTVDLQDASLPPLRRAARLVQEDLIVMRKGSDGWRLSAGSLSFPSSWHLREKFGKAMPQIHAAVPGFGEGSRNIALVQRMFDYLRPEHVFVRFNWGLYDGPALYHPAPGNGMRRFDAAGDISQVHLRVERQTLRRLPRTGEILFTIRTHLDPFDTLARHPEGPALARSLHAQIERLSPVQLAYKGLSEERGRLLARLVHIANPEA